MSERPYKWRDAAWKGAIIEGARDAIEYFMPDLASDMDLSKEITGITGMELPVQGSSSDKGLLISDIFLNVPVVGGEDWDVVCVVEQQHKNDKNVAAWMFEAWVRLRAQRPAGKTTGFVLYTGDAKNVNFYTESCYGLKASLEFGSFHLPSCNVEELKADKRPFARVVYAGYLSLGTEDDVPLREKYALEILNTTSVQDYDEKQRKFILEFAGRIFRLDDPQINPEVKEAYKVTLKKIPLSEYAQIAAEEARFIDGVEKGKVEMARNLLLDGFPLDAIAKSAGLSPERIQSLVNH
jgi:hypothetical protein